MDSGVFNPIFIGFIWSQEIEIENFVLEPGESLRGEFQAARRGDTLFTISSAAGIEVKNSIITFSITARQSALIPEPVPGSSFRWVFMDLVRMNAGGSGEEHLGLGLQIPAIAPITGPSA